MEKQFSRNWNSSVKPSKQRKFRFKAPLHIKGEFLNAHLSKELRAKYHKRSARVRVGDRVRILRGTHKKQEGKVEEVDVKKSVIFLSKIEHVKRDGTKARYPLQPSNVMIIELNTEDKRRFKDRKSAPKKEKAAPVPKAEKKPAEKKAAPKKEKKPAKKKASDVEKK